MERQDAYRTAARQQAALTKTVKTLAGRQATLTEQGAQREKRLAQMTRTLAQKQAQWATLQALARQGFDGAALTRLHALLTELAQQTGSDPAAVVADFFAVIPDYTAFVALTKNITALRAEVEALTTERATLPSGLAAVQREGQQRLQGVGTAATRAITQAQQMATQAIGQLTDQWQATVTDTQTRWQVVAERVRTLEREADQLGAVVPLARALRDPDPAAWQSMPPEAIEILVGQIVQWSVVTANTLVAMPETVRKSAKGSIEFPGFRGPFQLPLQSL